MKARPPTIVFQLVLGLLWKRLHLTIQCEASYSVQLWSYTSDRIRSDRKRSSRLFPLAAAARDVHEAALG